MLNLPTAFVERMKDQLGEEWPAFQQSLETAPPVSINYNTAKTDKPLFEGERVPWNPTGQYLPERPSFTLDPNFQAGRYYVQEAGSMLLSFVVRQLTKQHDIHTALDLCGAPGGKTTVLLNELPADSIVVANEVIKSRYGILRQNLAKWGRANSVSTHADSERFAPLAGMFDLVVVDAPCSGEGLFRKTPEATEEWSLENAALCESRQQRILDNSLPLVAPEGYLIYSTCTYNEGENDKQIARIMEQGDFERISLDIPADWGVTATQYGYQCYPHRTRSEGFYLAVLRQTAGNKPSSSKSKLKYYSNAPKAEMQAAQAWIKAPHPFSILTDPKGQLRMFPEPDLPLLAELTQHLPKVDPGTPMGTLKGKNFVPAHELALSVHLADAVPAVSLDEEEALAYLRKAPLQPWPNKTGWHLMQYESWGLGWAKLMDRRVNNYFPNGLRVRM
jgi:16S rRNA C967 or C1407 C5-methylase (RsmB/RsmF family)/NOL1/NOP2/fmu family ribosome biogenesis protein